MILGIVSIILCCLWFLSIPCAIAALIFGIVQCIRSSRKGLAIAGILMAVFSILLTVIFLLFGGKAHLNLNSKNDTDDAKEENSIVTEEIADDLMEALEQLPEDVITEDTVQDESELTTTDNDWADGTVYIDDEKYTIPFEAKELEDDGWVCDTENSDTTIAAGNLGTIFFDKGSNTLQVTINNMYSDEDVSYLDSPITCVYGDAAFNDNVKLENGITVGSSYEDVLAVLGEPSDKYTDGDYISLTYSLGGEYSDCLVITFLDGSEVTSFYREKDE